MAYHVLHTSHLDVKCPLSPQPAGQDTEANRTLYQRRSTPAIISMSTATAAATATATCQMDAAEPLWDSLENRRGDTTLTVLHKSQVQHVSYLTDLRATWKMPERSIRTVLGNDSLLKIPRSSTHISVAVVWWNALTADMDMKCFSTQQMKVAIYRCLRLHPS